jgi:hypothetical protein
MKAGWASEILVTFHNIILCHNPEDLNLSLEDFQNNGKKIQHCFQEWQKQWNVHIKLEDDYLEGTMFP